MLQLGNITTDCDDVMKVATFWSGVLRLPVDEGSNEFFAMIDREKAHGPTWLFIKVPEGKTSKNRMHVDFHADDLDAEIERVLALGATRGESHHEYGVQWTVLSDPEGNEFCVGRGDDD
jgi:predicted enzyme related to lactoylglutathione lyase